MSDDYKPIGHAIEVQSGFAFPSSAFVDNGVPIVRMSDLKEGDLNFKGAKFVSEKWLTNSPSFSLKENDFLLGMSGSLSNYAYVKIEDLPALLNQRVAKIKKKENDVCYKYICYWLTSHFYSHYAEIQGEGAAQKNISPKQISSFKIRFPSVDEQQKIATILSNIDTAIEKTEALINKYQKIKAGLMQDLFTRGVTADGKLRPPREQSPELYQETPIGWIPKEWKLEIMINLVESVVDGPFGSNLKTEHYVADPGIRVVRLQNIQETKYNDADKAFVSNKHADFLSHNKVVSGDVLIAGLGEDRYPVGRACLYPDNMPPAVNKADCFRLRCNSSEMRNAYMMFYLNTALARKQIKKYEQGVTRSRINTGNFKKILTLKPEIKEQEVIVERLIKVDIRVKNEQMQKEKFLLQKQGLMQDLLTGKVRVNVN